MGEGAPIQPPAIQAPRYGIEFVAPQPDVPADERWELGFKFTPPPCGNGGIVSATCGSFGDSLDPSRPPATVEGDAFIVWAGDKCSTNGRGARDPEQLARDQLAATRSFQIAQELWTGTLRDDESLANRALTDADSDTVTNGAVSPVAAVALLERALGHCGQGRRGMIHVTTDVLVHLTGPEGGGVQFQGGVWVTPTGNIVVADAGYDGTGPGGVSAGSSQWAYATSMISLRLGAVELIGDQTSRIDRTDNTEVTIAWQPVAYLWDECCHLAAEVNVAAPLLGGAS